ncbi:MAG: amidohydrolase family protein [Pseudomonadota bacterium]
MRRRAVAAIAAIWLLGAAAAAPGQAAAAGDTVIHAGQILAVPGRPAAGPHTIVVRGARIHSIREGFQTPAGLGLPAAAVIDLRDSFVMPGLLDTHVHLTTEPKPGGLEKTLRRGDAYLAIVAAVNAERVLAAGFTTVMDMGTGRRAHEKAIFAVRDAIAAGVLQGPEILAAGSPIAAAGASRTGRFIDALEAVIGPEGVCSGEPQCREAVREQVARGADFINFYNTGSLLADDPPASTFTLNEMTAIVAEAHALNRVAVADGGNTPGDASGIDTAIRAGADVIDTVTYPGPQTFRLLRRSGGAFSPHVHALNAAVGDSEDTLANGSMGWLPPPVLTALFALKQQTPSALAGYRAGARLVVGSDSGVFEHGLNANELVDYVALGIEPMDALAAATVNVAAAFRLLDRTGTLEEGKEADIVAFEHSPLDDIRTVTRPRLVMTDGRIHRLER